ncbi:MAG TPA: surface-adhesin E family protein [Geomonas sp.]|nr:surface-adhesin E family protein [Geomonas sp.]
MAVRVTLIALALLAFCGTSHGQEARWGNFAEDSDLRYYLDRRSVVPLPDNVYTFWVKSVAKDSEYFQNEYHLNNVSYVLTNYELDCAVSSFRLRSTVMFDKTRREISKILPMAGDTPFEPVQPETVLELAQEEICTGSRKAATLIQPPVPAEPSLSDDALAAPEPGNPFGPALSPAPEVRPQPSQPPAPTTLPAPAPPTAVTMPVPPETVYEPAAPAAPAAPEAPLPPEPLQ